VVNDLEAMAWSIPVLEQSQLSTLRRGTPDFRGNGAVIAPGTGLGEAGLIRRGPGGFIPFPSEGGHADFSPADEIQWELQVALAARFGHVSWERVVSGPGLLSVHEFQAENMSPAELEGCPLDGEEKGEPAPPAITRAAREGRCQACVRTVEQFCEFLGAEAGNLALKVLATGGVWIGGGIAPDILDFLTGDAFAEAFLAKGRMRNLMETIPVHVILDEKAPLLGAARCAIEGGSPWA
jgi:glucokinase